MKDIKTIIDFLEKIRAANVKVFDSYSDEKLMMNTDCNNLYQAFWQADFKLKNVISLLKCVEENNSHE